MQRKYATSIAVIILSLFIFSSSSFAVLDDAGAPPITIYNATGTYTPTLITIEFETDWYYDVTHTTTVWVYDGVSDFGPWMPLFDTNAGSTMPAPIDCGPSCYRYTMQGNMIGFTDWGGPWGMENVDPSHGFFIGYDEDGSSPYYHVMSDGDFSEHTGSEGAEIYPGNTDPNTDSWAFGATVVPEPISSTLFLIGGAALGFRRFRKHGRS